MIESVLFEETYQGPINLNELKDLRKQKVPRKEIVKKLKTNQTHIGYLLRKLNLQKKRINCDDVVTYWNSGKSLKNIAEKYGYTIEAIRRILIKHPDTKLRKCLCGCGRYAKKGNDYINQKCGNKGRKHTEEELKNMREAQNRPDYKIRQRKIMKEAMNRPEVRKKQKKSMAIYHQTLEWKEHKKKWHSNRISNPQLELMYYIDILSLECFGHGVELEQCVEGTNQHIFLDVFDRILKIDYEFDFQNPIFKNHTPEIDIKRNLELSEVGVTTFRFGYKDLNKLVKYGIPYFLSKKVSLFEVNRFD